MDDLVAEEVTSSDPAEGAQLQRKENEFSLKPENNTLECQEMRIPGEDNYSPSSRQEFLEMFDSHSVDRNMRHVNGLEHQYNSLGFMEDAGFTVEELTVRNCNNPNLAILDTSNNQGKMQARQNSWQHLYQLASGSGSGSSRVNTAFRDNGQVMPNGLENGRSTSFPEFLTQKAFSDNHYEVVEELTNTGNRGVSGNTYAGIRTKILSKSGFSEFFVKNTLKGNNRKPLLEAVEKMKEELMLLGFISLLLTATSSMIANICIPSKFYNSSFSPCSRSEIDEEIENNSSQERKLLMFSVLPHSFRRILNGLNSNSCKEGYEPFVSYQGLEQLHRFIFVMAITHISYSCLTMLLAIVKIHSWRAWEDEAHMDRHGSLTEITRQLTMRRQSSFVNPPNPVVRTNFFMWVTCFFRQFGRSVVRADYLTLRKGFIMNHNLSPKYDFHSYMIRSMEEEFQRIVGVSGPLWGFVVAFMLFNIKGSNLYFWIAIIPIALVLLVGMKLQYVIATLALENAGITGSYPGAKLRPRDDLFWFKKPELLLSLIHFSLFQNAFELASFFWFWWQFGYNSCFIRNHLLVYLRLIVGFAGQFLCSYSTLPLYALVTQMGTNYKAALIPQRIRETIHGWGKAARRKRRLGIYNDESTIHTDTSTVMSLEEDDHEMLDNPAIDADTQNGIELQPVSSSMTSPCLAANENSSRAGTPLLRPSASVSVSSPVTLTIHTESIPRSTSMPSRR